MIKKDVFFNWIYTLVIGAVVAMVLFQSFQSSLISVVALILSLPYLIIMLTIVTRLRGFWHFQLVHFGLTLCTVAAIFFISENLKMSLVPFAYMGLSLLIEVGLQFSRNENETVQ